MMTAESRSTPGAKPGSGRKKLRFSLRTLVAVALCAGALTVFGPRAYYSLWARYCFAQIRSQNASAAEEPIRSDPDATISVETWCFNELIKNGRHYLPAILDRIGDPNESIYLRRRLMAAFSFHGDWDRTLVSPVCFTVLMDESEPWEIRRAAGSVLRRNNPVTRHEVRRLLHSTADGGRSYIEIFFAKIQDPKEPLVVRRQCVGLINSTGGIEPDRTVPLWFQIMTDNRQPAELRSDTMSLLLSGNSLVQNELRRMLDVKTAEGRANRERLHNAALVARKTDPVFAGWLETISKSTDAEVTGKDGSKELRNSEAPPP